jgi:hypothetical protein
LSGKDTDFEVDPDPGARRQLFSGTGRETPPRREDAAAERGPGMNDGGADQTKWRLGLATIFIGRGMREESRGIFESSMVVLDRLVVREDIEG